MRQVGGQRCSWIARRRWLGSEVRLRRGRGSTSPLNERTRALNGARRLTGEQIPDGMGCHAPPRAVRTPRALSAEAMPSSVAIPAARISRMIGRTLAAKRSASTDVEMAKKTVGALKLSRPCKKEPRQSVAGLDTEMESETKKVRRTRLISCRSCPVRRLDLSGSPAWAWVDARPGVFAAAIPCAANSSAGGRASEKTACRYSY